MLCAASSHCEQAFWTGRSWQQLLPAGMIVHCCPAYFVGCSLHSFKHDVQCTLALVPAGRYCLSGFELAAPMLQTVFKKCRVVVAAGSVGCRLCFVCTSCQSIRNWSKNRQSTSMCCGRRMKADALLQPFGVGCHVLCFFISVCLCGHALLLFVGVKFRVKVMAE